MYWEPIWTNCLIPRIIRLTWCHVLLSVTLWSWLFLLYKDFCFSSYLLTEFHTSIRYAVAFYYPHSSWSALQSIPWSGRYVFDDDIIRYVSIENRKSGGSSAETAVNAQGESTPNKDGGPSILVHTSVPFGIQHKNTDESEVYEMIQNHLDMVLPNLGTRTVQD